MSLGRVGTNVKAVFFDAVGTLLFPSPPPTHVYAAAARRRGVEVSPELIRDRLWTAFRAAEEEDRDAGWRVDEDRERGRWRAIVAASLPEVGDSDGCFAELWDHFARPDAWRPHPEAGEVLRTLAERGLKLGMASNFDARLRSVVGGIPELAPLRERCVVSSLVGWRKPSPSFFRAVAEAAGWAPEHVLFVGDQPENDVEGARAAGMLAVLYDPEGLHRTAASIASLRDLL